MRAFLQFGAITNRAIINVHIQILCESKLFLRLNNQLGVERQSRVASVRLTVQESTTLTSRTGRTISHLTSNVREVQLPHDLTSTWYVQGFPQFQPF